MTDKPTLADWEALAAKEVKGADLSWHTSDALDAVAHAVNTRPRKTLGWKTPAEALDHLLADVHDGGVATTG